MRRSPGSLPVPFLMLMPQQVMLPQHNRMNATLKGFLCLQNYKLWHQLVRILFLFCFLLWNSGKYPEEWSPVSCHIVLHSQRFSSGAPNSGFVLRFLSILESAVFALELTADVLGSRKLAHQQGWNFNLEQQSSAMIPHSYSWQQRQTHPEVLKTWWRVWNF